MANCPSKTDQAYDLLESMIVSQILAPGSRVSEAKLMEMTGLGRSPIREALQRLAWDRMVEVQPHLGALIAPISIEEQLKLLELGRCVEELAVRIASHRASTVQKQDMLQLADELEKSVAKEDEYAYGSILKKIHKAIVTAVQNEYLKLALAPLQGQSRRFWLARLINNKTELSESVRLHVSVLRAIGQGDANAAAAASLELNDRLTAFAYRTLHHINSHFQMA